MYMAYIIYTPCTPCAAAPGATATFLGPFTHRFSALHTAKAPPLFPPPYMYF